MSELLKYNFFYLVGIKGVAMTAMAELLIDAHKSVSGCDVAEDFVTQPTLDKLTTNITIDFDHEIPKNTECVIYTSAHSGINNPIVQQAIEKNIPIYSHAEALALFTQGKKTIAVCGVGGKSTVTAMIAWIFEKLEIPISYSVGVGTIPQLNRAARYQEDSEFFIVEADEYVTDPSALKNNQPITPRFSFLHPFITIATNIAFDHPDVYQDFSETTKQFEKFFNQIDSDGALILNQKAARLGLTTSAQQSLTFGKTESSDIYYEYNPQEQQAGKTVATVTEKLNKKQISRHSLILQLPGEYNIMNALAAIAAAHLAGISVTESISALQTFASTQRRFELKKSVGKLTFYDDYAHHPQEIISAIKALNNWYPHAKKVIAFQPHTYSRTKQLLHEFTHAFKDSETVYLLDIFASARESTDPSISSDLLVEKIQDLYPNLQIKNVHTLENLKKELQSLNKSEATVVLTLGAGDIYKVHDMI